MVIFNRDGVIVRQHPFLEYYQVEQWCYRDCSYSYGLSWDYHTVFESTNLDEVKQKVLELLDSK